MKLWCPKQLLELLLLAVVAYGACGCEDGSNPTDRQATADGEENVARSQVERGPLRFTVEVEPKHSRLSDEQTLTLTLDYERGLTVTKPPFGESVGEFLILDFHEPPTETKGEREIIRQVYSLEPARAGDLVIAPIQITFRDTRPDGDGKEHTVESEGLTIEVTTVLGEDAPSLTDLRPATGPIELPATSGSALWWWVSGVLVLLVATGVVLWRRARRQSAAAAEATLSAFELAYLELQKLIEDKLAESEVKLFFVELTAIVRRYIERTTGVHAAEQTTEEFLREIGDHPTFSDDERGRLRDFLESADLVKFAAHQPNQQDIEESFERAKRFIGMPDAAQEVAA